MKMTDFWRVNLTPKSQKTPDLEQASQPLPLQYGHVAKTLTPLLYLLGDCIEIESVSTL